MSPDEDAKTAEDGWMLLRAGGRESTGLEIPTVRTDVTAPMGPVRLALGENGEARVLLPISDREIPQGLVGAPALRITVSTYSSAGRQARFLDLTCLAKDLEAVFGEVADQVLGRIASGESCVEAARSTIEDFRALLARPSSSDHSTSIVAGLVGELIVLNRLLDRSPRAWRCWRGPIGDRHDFRSGSSSLEVKASLRAGRSSITVNGFYQLEAPTGGGLHLLHLVLEPVAAGMLGVSALGRSALTKADDPDRVRELLGAIGCPDVDAEEWNGPSFRLESETIYEIADGFPRLVPSILVGGIAPAGVSDVAYSTDLSVAGLFARGPFRFAEIEDELVKWL